MKKDRTRTGLFIPCPCGSQAGIADTGSRYYAHCPRCGAMTFWRSSALTERVRLGGSLCAHKPQWKLCNQGNSKTSWCKICRVRVFMPVSQKEG